MTISAETRREFHRFDDMLGPEYRAELIAGEIIVNPPPHGTHEQVFAKLNNQLVKKSAIEIEVSGHRGIETPLGDYIPDMTITEPDTFGGKPPWGSPEGILLLVEITSSMRASDRVAKRRAYAAAGIPFYLLVDRQNVESVLFSQPDVEAQDYRADIRVPFGSDLELPAPFSFTLTDFTPRAPRPREL
ncbi:Uma2 family endonuclease [Catenulispora pinisilvae]|uniref:Uma2 family endonuclease n=1 Tax=Catenulispora pinisilvae TaxID=2705253 RepID=UPI0018927A49|nr:Uma2 family endonuclease [Catenulispora pinisilvae]